MKFFDQRPVPIVGHIGIFFQPYCNPNELELISIPSPGRNLLIEQVSVRRTPRRPGGAPGGAYDRWNGPWRRRAPPQKRTKKTERRKHGMKIMTSEQMVRILAGGVYLAAFLWALITLLMLAG